MPPYHLFSEYYYLLKFSCNKSNVLDSSLREAFLGRVLVAEESSLTNPSDSGPSLPAPTKYGHYLVDILHADD